MFGARKKTFVDAEVQGALLMRLAGHWCLFVIANCIAFAFWEVLVENSATGATASPVLSGMIPCLITSAALLPAFLYDTVRLTNRFAGPVMRLRKSLRELAEGRPVEPLKFRKGDFWATAADDFNAAMRRMAAGTADVDAWKGAATDESEFPAAGAEEATS